MVLTPRWSGRDVAIAAASREEVRRQEHQADKDDLSPWGDARHRTRHDHGQGPGDDPQGNPRRPSSPSRKPHPCGRPWLPCSNRGSGSPPTSKRSSSRSPSGGLHRGLRPPPNLLRGWGDGALPLSPALVQTQPVPQTPPPGDGQPGGAQAAQRLQRPAH